MELLPQLKEEHIEILRPFDVVEADIRNSSKSSEDIIDDLRDLKDTLTSHVDLENKLLYPAIESSNDKKTKEAGKKFSGEMIKIGEVAFAFFKKYDETEISEIRTDQKFKTEFKDIHKILSRRVDVEENKLFPLYSLCCE